MDSTAKDKHSPYVTIPNTTFYVPKYTWRCDVFGNRIIVVDVMETQSPTAWQRFWAKFFLGTKWERIA